MKFGQIVISFLCVVKFVVRGQSFNTQGSCYRSFFFLVLGVINKSFLEKLKVHSVEISGSSVALLEVSKLKISGLSSTPDVAMMNVLTYATSAPRFTVMKNIILA